MRLVQSHLAMNFSDGKEAIIRRLVQQAQACSDDEQAAILMTVALQAMYGDELFWAEQLKLFQVSTISMICRGFLQQCFARLTGKPKSNNFVLWQEGVAMTEKLKEKTRSIDIIGASAGTGKTTRLSTEFVNAVEGTNGNPPIDPTRIIVCTFTNKAADELSARIRQRLLEGGNTDAAQLVLASYVGTVNSICGRLLKDYALEGGLSPDQDVVPEHMQSNLFAIATANVLDAFAQRIEPIARRLSLTDAATKSRYRKNTTWMQHVRDICSLARANSMTDETLRMSAFRSWQGVQRHLRDRVEINEEEVEDALHFELERVINEIDTSNDPTGKTAEYLKNLRECYGRARFGALTWRDWAVIKKVDVGKNSRDIVKDLAGVCSVLPHHPRLHADLEEYIRAVFECSIEALAAYQEYKKANGLVDFVDQEHLALKLLDNPLVCQSLKERFDLVLIDEFQDTSPIQLALFLKLAELVRHSIWVGDVKQAIYGFRGTDPQLMQESARVCNRQPPLEESYRSRPELVHFSNEVFRRVFPEYGIAEEDVVIRPSGKRPAAAAHTIELWRCQGTDLSDCFASLASAIHDLLHGGVRHIDDPHTGKPRALRGSDIAVLCRKNEHCSNLATALAETGIKAMMTRGGLLDTPECLLTISTLRYLFDADDKPALGTMVFLQQNFADVDQSAWLNEWLKAGWKTDELLPNQTQVRDSRQRLPMCSITDALGLAIDCGRVLQMAAAWGNVSLRLSNLDALRGLVVEYEDTCSMARTAATVSGFLMYLEELEDDEQPPSVDVDAVNVLTYHGSKGLEWPVVILADLDAEAAPKVHKDLCRIYVEPSENDFDVNNPLLGRWIRLWPWPFGSIEKDGDFEASAVGSPEFAVTERRLRAENTRLMYVGITRARDMLVLSPYTGRKKNPTGTQWLEELTAGGAPVLTLPNPDENEILVGDSRHHARMREFEPALADARQTTHAQTYWPVSPAAAASKSSSAASSSQPADASQTREFLPYSLRPSQLSAQTSSFATEVISIGERIPIKGEVDMTVLGDCVHSFLAVDDCSLLEPDRLRVAERILGLWKIDHITADNLLTMGNRLDSFLQDRFGIHTRHSECPVAARIGNQRLRGTIDLLIETEDCFHIFDHKSFLGAADQMESKALSYAPQLLAYKQGLAASSNKPINTLAIHMPFVAKIILFH